MGVGKALSLHKVGGPNKRKVMDFSVKSIKWWVHNKVGEGLEMVT